MDSGKSLIARSQRIFLALWPDEEVQGQLVAHRNQWSWPPGSARYLPADWHVTVHFIGNVDADQVANISTSADVPFEPFELVLDQPVLWSHGLAVLRATAVPKALQALYDRLGHALRALDRPVETRPYQPHVTLARRADDAIPPTAATPVVWSVRRFVLVVSTGNKDPRYRVIRQYR